MKHESIRQQIQRRGYARRSVTPDEAEGLEKMYDVRIHGECGLGNGKRIVEIRPLKQRR